MSASTGEGCDEWDELPLDGAEAWFGLLLMAGSGVVTCKILAWIAGSVLPFITQ